MTTPWYLTVPALKIIARLKANPPRREFERDSASRNWHDGSYDYIGFDAIALRSLFRRKWNDLQLNGWDREASLALMQTSADEVLASLFGDPNGLDWAHHERAAFRTALAAEIDAALGAKVAA